MLINKEDPLKSRFSPGDGMTGSTGTVLAFR